MNFTTQIPIPIATQLINYNSKIVSLGSCFAVNMAEPIISAVVKFEWDDIFPPFCTYNEQ